MRAKIYKAVIWSLPRLFRQDPNGLRYLWFGSPNAYLTDQDLLKLFKWSQR